MENLQIILSVAGTALGLLITTATFLLKFIKSTKAKKILESVIKIGNAVTPCVEKAETFLNYTGAEKKNFVMTEAAKFAIAHKIPFDEKLVSDKIEELVKLTKSVNAREQDKTITPLEAIK